jgi:hypothetical protein
MVLVRAPVVLHLGPSATTSQFVLARRAFNAVTTMSVEARVASYVGAFLSAYDETAVEGVERLTAACKDAEESDAVHALLEDPSAIDAFMSLFNRPRCPLEPILNSCSALLSIARKPARALMLRLLATTKPRQRIAEAVGKLSDKTLTTTISALDLMSLMIEYNAKQTVSKYGRKVPIQSSTFADSLSFALSTVRVPRLRLLAAFFNAKHPEIAANAVTQHGCLTRFVEDVVELSKRDAHHPLLRSCVHTLHQAFVSNPLLSAADRRGVLTSQRGVTKAIAALLGVAPLAEAVAALLRNLVQEIAEPSGDYATLRDADDSRMPNFTLFSLLRHLRPKHRVLDAHLVVYVLYRCPELYRPFLLRVARKLPEFEDNISIPRASVAVCNVLTRLYLCPLPEYITSQSARLVDATGKASHFYDLTPEAAADEVLPPWFAEAAHRLVTSNSDNFLMLSFLLQCMQAAVERAARVKRALQGIFTAARERATARVLDADNVIDAMASAPDGTDDQVDEDAFMAQFDSEVQSRLPKREVLLPHFATAVSAVAAAGTKTANGRGVSSVSGDTKEQFLVQRVYLYLASAANVFNWRTAWTPVLPSPTHPWSVDVRHTVTLRRANGTTVRAVCCLLLNNLTRHVRLPKLSHVSMSNAAPGTSASGGGKGGKHVKGKDGRNASAPGANGGDATALPHAAGSPAAPPLLLELLYWAIAVRDEISAQQPADIAAVRAVVSVTAWYIRSVCLGADVTETEVALWLKYATADQATLLVHVVNHVAQLSSKLQQVLVENWSKSEVEGGFLSYVAKVFADKQTKKTAERGEAGAASSSNWATHLRSYLPALSELAAKVDKRWAKREAVAEELCQYSAVTTSTTPGATNQRSVPHVHHSMMLRRAAGEMVKGNDVTTLVVNFFSRSLLPAAVDNEATSMPVLQGLRTRQSTPDAIVASLVASDEITGHRFGRWLAARILLAALPNASESPDAVLRLLHRVAAAEPPSQDNALELAGHAVLLVVLVRHLALKRVAVTVDARAAVADHIIGLYHGTLGTVDRVLFSALALWEYTPAAPIASGARAGPVDESRSESAADDAVVDDGDDADKGSDATPAEAADEDDADEDDESDEHPVVRNSSILGGPAKQRGPRTENQPAKGNGAKASNHPAAKAPRRRAPPCLTAFERARFLVGGALCLPRSTPEVEALTGLVESMSDRELVVNAMQLPLRITTPVPEDAARHPLRLIFPDVHDRQRVTADTSSRWYTAAPNADGQIEPYVCDAVSTSVRDPRFLLPLVHTVCCLRYKHIVAVPNTTVVRLAPLAVRSLSMLDGTLRRLGLDCLALMYRSLHPLPRLVVNAVRLQLQKGMDPHRYSEDSPPPRLSAPHSAHFTLTFSPIGHPRHSLHAIATESLNLPDERAVPLDDLLVDFPQSAVTGTPTPGRPNELRTTPHIRHILEQLKYSCVSWQDYALLERRNILEILCLDATVLLRDPPLRRSVLAALRGVCLCHADDVSVRAAVQGHVVQWALSALHAWCNPADLNGFEDAAVDLAALLRQLYSFFRTSTAHHRRTASVLIGVLEHAQRGKVLSRPLLYETLTTIGLAWRMGGVHGGVLAAPQERAMLRRMLTTFEESGAMASAAGRRTELPIITKLAAFAAETAHSGASALTEDAPEA